MASAAGRPIKADAGRTELAWIDATRPASGRRLWGMTLVERQIRELARLGLSRIAIWVSPQSQEQVQQLRPDLGSLYPVELQFRLAAETTTLGQALEEVSEPLILLEGDVVYDERILADLRRRGPGTAVAGPEEVVAFHLSAEQARHLGALLATDRRMAVHREALGCQTRRPEELEQYLPALRLTMIPLMVRVPAVGSLQAIDRLMYRRTFKGAIDAVARYGYYHLVRWITRHLCETTLPPNLFTVLSILAVWATIPCFAGGHLGLGIGMAWIGVILDSVDGKLARLRLHLSDAMGAIEHFAAMPGLGLWYLALGWHLSGGALLARNAMALTTWILVAAFLLDKATTGTFKALYGRELFDYGRLDAWFHLIAARRNISLLLLSVGTLAGRPAPAFIAVSGWSVATWVFHLFRFVWIALARKRGEGASS